MTISLYIAKRYLLSKSSTNAINIMSIIAAFGVVITSCALFVLLSVFGGLKDFSLEFSSFTDPDLKLFPKTGKSMQWSTEDSITLSKISEITKFSYTIEERVFVTSDHKNLVATLKGVDQNYLKVTALDSMIQRGKWFTPNSNEVVSGTGISNQLAFGVFSFLKPLSLYVPKAGKGQITSLKGAYNSAYVSNVGLFSINESLDNNYVFSDISLARSLLNYTSNQISAIELQLSPNANETEVRSIIELTFGKRLIIKNRMELNDAIYKVFKSETLAGYLICVLIMIIALFNIVGAIIMMILDRKKSLNTLYSLGLEVREIKNVFFLQGTLMTLCSGILGIVLGIILVVVQYHFELLMLTPELPYPVKFEFKNIIIVLVTIIILGLIASKIASQRISKKLVQIN